MSPFHSRYRKVKNVDAVIDIFVVRFYTAYHMNLPPEFPRVITAGELFQLTDEFSGFPGRDEPGGLHGVHQKL